MISKQISQQRKEIQSKIDCLFREIAGISSVKPDLIYDNDEKLDDIQSRISQIHQLVGQDRSLYLISMKLS